MKKILLAAHSLNIGGIEKALITLANHLQEKGYAVTVVLEKKEGIFLNQLNSKISIIEYSIVENGNVIKRKIKNFLKRIEFFLKYKNQFDFSACFATYSIPSSVVSRIASTNSCLWGHADYLTLFDQDQEAVRKFFHERSYEKFKHIVFVSEEGKETFVKIFPEMKDKTITCNNLIDAKKMKQLAQEEILIKKEKDITTFLNVGRHDEKQKKLTRLIEAAERLKQEKETFRVLLIGDGPDTKQYQELVKEKKLEKEVIFLGRKQNPYPYFKIADCAVITSDYEGYPVVFLECFILNLPILTTKVSDYQQIENYYGYVMNKTVEDISAKMKQIIQKGYEIKQPFDSEEYNQEIEKKIEKLIEKG